MSWIRLTRDCFNSSNKMRAGVWLTALMMILISVTVAKGTEAFIEYPSLASVISLYGKILVRLVTTIGGLLIYIWKTSMSTLREFVQKDINGVGEKVNISEKSIQKILTKTEELIRLDERVKGIGTETDKLRGNFDSLIRTLNNDFLKKDDHKAWCETQAEIHRLEIKEKEEED